MNIGGMWSELRRRKVVRLAIVYAIVAWIVIQAAATIFPALAVPTWGVSLVVILVALGFPIALVLSWMFEREGSAVRREKSRTRAVETDDKSIAVLPFVNMSDDRDNEYFSDGITEEILNALVRVKSLRVASRTSSFTFKAKELDVREIADQLGVATVLEGSVRKSNNRLRITAQLINATSGYHLWSDTYDRELDDVFQIQDDIARAIVAALKVELAGEDAGPLVAKATDNIEAYNLYLKGRFFLRYKEADLWKSLEYYREALQHDSGYGRAYAGIADAWMFLADDWMPPEKAYAEAKVAALKAIELDESLAEAHTALGKVLGWFEWDFDGGELALRRAVANNPNYGDAHWGLGSILPPNGQLSEGIEEMRTAQSLDPLHSSFSYWLARFLMFDHRFDEAIAEAQSAIELDPNSHRPYLVLGQSHLSSGNAAEALEEFQRSLDVSGAVSVNACAARALAVLGREDEARSILADLEAHEEYVRNEFMAAAFGALGEFDRAFEQLDQAYAARSAGLIYLHVDPAYDSLRGDPRYIEMVKKIGLRTG